MVTNELPKGREHRSDRFVWGTVALSGNTLAVGARIEDSNAAGIDGDQTNNVTSASGAVYVFRREGAIWLQEAYIKASNPDQDDFFGTVGIRDDILVVGAQGESSAAVGIGGDQSDNTSTGSGAAYAFGRSTTGTWSQLAYMKASNTDSSDAAGVSVAVSANGTVVFGSKDASADTGVNGDQANNSAASAGAVYVLE